MTGTLKFEESIEITGAESSLVSSVGSFSFLSLLDTRIIIITMMITVTMRIKSKINAAIIDPMITAAPIYFFFLNIQAICDT